jgi:hypothetical protein
MNKLENFNERNLDKLFSENKDKTKIKNPVNNLQDYKNLKIIVWSYPKTGTTTLASSLQNAYDKTTNYKNVVHCHSQHCWYSFHNYLNQTNFNFNILINYINFKGIKPCVIQSYREPITRLISFFFQTQYNANINLWKINKDKIIEMVIDFMKDKNNFFKEKYYNYLKTNICHFKNFNKKKGYGFEKYEKYNVLYVNIDTINKLEENIKEIPELAEFHNLKILKLNDNKSELYNYVNNNIKISKNLYDELYKNEKEILDFYYTEDEIIQIKKNTNKYIL